ncbi:MAG TPA: hypothetical protein GX700_07660 [Paracoccus sp.]|nr:hypothetical protein [Paracoccus sp. (in: a-proteobacteria)]
MMLDLTKLANLPGAGTAQAALRAAGHWDEHAGCGPERRFEVYLSAHARVEACVTVKVRCKAGADEKARLAAGERWEFAGDLHDVEVETILDSRS